MSGTISGTNDDTKSLRVVFQRTNVFREDDYDYQYEYVSKVKLDPINTEAIKNAAKKALQLKLDAMKGDFERKPCKKEANIAHLIEAIKDSNDQENLATNKFVDVVESMMTRFNMELEKLQKIYTKVMNNLPKIDVK